MTNLSGEEVFIAKTLRSQRSQASTSFDDRLQIAAFELKKQNGNVHYYYEYLIYGDCRGNRRGGLFIFFVRFVQKIFRVLFSYYKTSKKRNKWALITTQLK